MPPKVARWALILEEFNYEVIHRPGNNMKHVDALSRYPVCMITCEILQSIKLAQKEDTYLNPIFAVLEKTDYKDFIIESGVLYKQIEGSKLLVIPSSMQNEIIRKTHEDNGHFKDKKMLEILNKEYWMPEMNRKIAKITRNCVSCILAKRKHGKKEGFLNAIDRGEKPLETYHIDHLDPMPSTSKKYLTCLLS